MADTASAEDRQSRWDPYFSRQTYDETRYHDWIYRHLPALPSRASILELGCGLGFLSELLFRRGYPVIATDNSDVALGALSRRVKGLPTQHVDLEQPLPFGDGSFDAVIADLCLHYFDAQTTHRVLGEVRRVLTPDGTLFCRVNSTQDHVHGAEVGRVVEPGLYESDGHYKRSFDADMIRGSLGGWSIRSMVNYDFAYVGRLKNVWEVVAKSGPG